MVNFKSIFIALLGIILSGCFESQFDACINQESKRIEPLSKAWGNLVIDVNAIRTKYEIKDRVTHDDMNNVIESIRQINSLPPEFWSDYDNTANNYLDSIGWKQGDWYGDEDKFELTDEQSNRLNALLQEKAPEQEKIWEDYFYNTTLGFYNFHETINNNEKRLMHDSPIAFNSVVFVQAINERLAFALHDKNSYAKEKARAICNANGLYK